jgi:hypothetical protein
LAGIGSGTFTNPNPEINPIEVRNYQFFRAAGFFDTAIDDIIWLTNNNALAHYKLATPIFVTGFPI